MRAHPGDWLVVKGTVVDAPVAIGQIVEVRRSNGEPPYLVRWTHDNREALVFPGPDAHVVSAADKARADERERARLDELQREIGRSC